VNLFINSKPAFLQEAYWWLTGDCSASSNLTERDVDQQIAQLLEDEDPDLIWDLRVNNMGCPETTLIVDTYRSGRHSS